MNSRPRISLVTPSFNQAAFLEQTIQSVLDQDYPNLEYIVVDGGSTDNSAQIIRRYADRLAWWVSESDGGQSEAINKGFARATGELGNWLCSDDVLLPGALHAVAEAYERNPSAVAWYGDGVNIDVQGHKVCDVHAGVRRAPDIGVWIPESSGTIFQPSCFFSLARFRAIGGLCEELHRVMDVHVWARLASHGDFVRIDAALSGNRNYPETKTNRAPVIREVEHLGMLLRMGREDLVLRRFDYLQRMLLGAMEQRTGRQALAAECSRGLSWQTLVLALVKKLSRRFTSPTGSRR